MFGDKFIWDEQSETYAKQIFDGCDKNLLLKKSIISIGGISGTRKSETAYRLAEILITHGKRCHIISGDDYYTTQWHVRNDVRKKNIDIVGPEEWDWSRINWTFETFRNDMHAAIQYFQLSKFSTELIDCFISKKGCSILIFEGLYACDIRIDADLKVHLGECTPESTLKFRKERAKENESNTFRKKVVDLECKAIEKLKDNADLIL